MIDWNRLTFDPVLSEFGELLRAEFNVRVLLVDGFSKAYDLGQSSTPIEALQRLLGSLSGPDFSGLEPAPGEAGLTSAELQADGPAPDPLNAEKTREEKTREEKTREEKSRDGLYMLRAPIKLSAETSAHAGSADTHLVVAGYAPSELAYDAFERARELLKERQIDEERLADVEALIDEIPLLDRRARQMICQIIRRMLARVDSLLAPDHPAQTPEERLDARIDGAQFYGMIGNSRSVRALFDAILRVAPGQSTVLIQGENGTGKELIARAIHAESPRRDEPFVALNCAAFAGDLIASELFGHKRGAFSGAHKDRPGLLQEAHGGTLLLDEIGDMELGLQVKLLRFLQEGTFMPVGDNVERRVDVRVLCATNKDLEAMVRDGKFRQDLFFRINVINLVSPPLRRRRRDIPILAKYFLARAARRHQLGLKTLSQECLDELRTHDWPGNVRELENEIERLVIMSGDQAVIDAALLSPRILASEEERFDALELGGLQMPEAVEKLERMMILEKLKKTGWNKSETARQLGVSRRNLIRKVQRFGLED